MDVHFFWQPGTVLYFTHLLRDLGKFFCSFSASVALFCPFLQPLCRFLSSFLICLTSCFSANEAFIRFRKLVCTTRSGRPSNCNGATKPSNAFNLWSLRSTGIILGTGASPPYSSCSCATRPGSISSRSSTF
ncbi:hypothetical protein BO94DRAFT_130418 [Aspergillus sclerotioniger CBS 115572]|uniref:Uncharacterized protein n=1 Tax=Aspergillus sclerotioniger CBS 115572 TaxID=1450535 RepID=A0A317XDA1_9EURO|nr:hypothetical protein BO94DRAFT_130418 [Aspergillus sclerotioniger CBS 115572]PWY95577.1 hypothetical protein BO94DRAFT_130418 [Aspergillus sclerotioniger CBS 115572]